jgi:hypothetical protein
MTALLARARSHRPFLCTALACTFVFGWMVTFGSFQFIAEDTFGSFYDHQAAAWLKGRWDVPEPALSGEAFIVNGKVYGYFGPTPALMRLPLVFFGLGFASVTRALMTLDYVACLAAVYALLRLAVRWRQPDAQPRQFSTVLLTSTAGLGSTLFFLGSRAYVYHEAILCGAALALWSVFAALRYLQAPASRWWIAALSCGFFAVHARAPLGLFALSVLGCIALVHLAKRLVRARPLSRAQNAASAPQDVSRSWKLHLTVAAASAIAVASFNAVSYLKFGTFEGCPLRFNVQYTPEKLAVLGHRNFHLSNLRFNADAYLFRPALSFSPQFPYLYREFLDRKKYPESRMAYRDQTLAMPWSMPGLFVLAVASVLVAKALPRVRPPIVVLWIAAVPAALAMLTAVAVTQRYTADFCPFLIAVAAFTVAGLESLSGAIGRLTRAAAGALAALGIAITFALTLHHQREIVWGVPDDVRREYQEFRRQPRS